MQATPVATAIRENEILFPWIEAVHVLAVVLVVGTISIVDLRLLGLASLDRAVSRLMRDVVAVYLGCLCGGGDHRSAAVFIECHDLRA